MRTPATFCLPTAASTPKPEPFELSAHFLIPVTFSAPDNLAASPLSRRMQQNALLVPQRAVTELQGRYQVAIVGPDNKINIRTVQVGDNVGELWIVESGLKPGDRVVSEGISKVKDGARVTPQPDKLNGVSPYPAQGEAK